MIWRTNALGAVMMLIVLAAGSITALAQSSASPPPLPRNPLGVGQPTQQRGLTAGRPAMAPKDLGPLDRAWLWLRAKQAEVNRALVGAVRRMKTESLLVSSLLLAALSFAYGVLHAAGPGHGKAIIASYVLANERTVRRGIFLSFLSAFVQALSAILLVGILVVAFKATGIDIRRWEALLETISWAVVALVGVWLLYGQLVRLGWIGGRAGAHVHAHTHAHHEHAQGHADHHGHDHHHHDDGCDHAHMPDPRQLDGELSWRKAMSIALAVGIRPCTGAIVVLVFALSQGLLWAGVFATFAMALGTAITVSALAALAVGSRDLAERLGGGSSGWVRGVQTVAGIGGATAVMVLGVAFFVASLGGSGPF